MFLTLAAKRLLVAIPTARDLMGLEPLSAGHWLLATGIAFAYLGTVELDKSIHRHRATTPEH